MKQGFSLIELLIVITIITILAGIASPSYRGYLAHARRSDGAAALLDLANRMENYYVTHSTYATATIASGALNTNAATDVLSNNRSAEQWYILSITAANTASYILQATPTLAQASEDTICQSLTLNSFGQQGITAGPAGYPAGNAAECWH